jgi:tetratricopeptide (TPR) repeat protein
MNTSSQLIDTARTCLKNKDIPQAQRVLKEALSRDPRNAEIHLLLGGIHYYTGELSKAERDYYDAIALNDPRILPEAHFELGLIRERQNRPGDAQHEYEETLRIAPNHARARQKLRPPPPHSKDDESLVVPERGSESAAHYTGKLLYAGKRRIRSFSGPFLLPFLAAIVFVFLALTDKGSSAEVARFTIMAVMCGILIWVILLLGSNTTKYHVYEGRIDITSGVVYSRTTSIWLFEIEQVFLTRTLWNRLTGDAVLHIIEGVSSRPLHWKMTGLGDHIFVRKLWEEMRDSALVRRRLMKRWWI